MPATLIDICPLCGLRFGNMPLFELHIREDHRRPSVHPKDGAGSEDNEEPQEETRVPGHARARGSTTARNS